MQKSVYFQVLTKSFEKPTQYFLFILFDLGSISLLFQAIIILQFFLNKEQTGQNVQYKNGRQKGKVLKY